MSRWKAAGIHLALSFAIALIVALILITVWYPPPYFHGAGADTLVLLLAGVDVVLGPFITLIIFRSGKKGLKLDLAIIGFLQTAALLYGLNVVLQSRPVFLVAAVDRLALVSANEIEAEDLKAGSKPEFQTLSWTGPRLVGLRMPTDPDERFKLMMSALEGKDAEKYPKYYVDYAESAKSLLKRAQSLDVLYKTKPESEALVHTYLDETKLKENLVWVPIQTRKEFMTMLLSAETGQPLKALAIDPW